MSSSVEKVSEPRGVLRRSRAVGGSALLAGGAAGSTLLMSLFASPVGAVTTFTVDTNADGVANASDCVTPVASSCSLRDALAAANTDGDVIVFDGAMSGQTISLSQGQLIVTAGITITGLGSANLTVDAGGYSRVFYIEPAGTPSADVVFSGLSIINGDAPGDNGGGIYDMHDGDFTLNDVSITGCDASYGGAVYKDSDGDIEIVDSTISDNHAMINSGALYNNGVGDLIITNSIFDGNVAGSGGVGQIGNDGNVTIVGSTFSNNYADGSGGVFYITSDVTGDVSISGSSFVGNEATDGGGAIYTKNDGSLTVTSSTFSGNISDDWGGALYLGTTGQVVSVTDSLFADNYASTSGGAIDSDANDQIVTINNSTFVGNSSGSSGGAIWKNEGGSLTINMSTITENSAASGGGVYFEATYAGQADVTITGTILTGNTGNGGVADDLNTQIEPYLPVATISDSVLGVVDADITVTASNNIDATAPGFVLGLAALADNGGTTETMALLTGSPAIDAGPATVPTFTGNGFDQRGTPYVRVYNGQSDIGAFELQPDPTPVTTTTVASDESVVPTFTG